MKSFLLVGICLLLTGAGICQDSTIAVSRFETLCSQADQLTRIERRKVGWAGGLPVAKVKRTELTTGESSYAITFNYSIDGSITIRHPTVIYVDMEEVDSLITSLSTFLQEVNEIKNPDGVRYSYITKSDVMVSCEFLSWTENWRFYIGKIYKVLRTPVANSTVQVNKKRVPELIALLKQAKTMEW